MPPQQQLKILFLRDDIPHIVKEINTDLIDALRDLGMDLCVLDLTAMNQAMQDGNHALTGELQKQALAAIRDFAPDLALGYGFNGIMAVGEDDHVLNRLGIPYVALLFDNPLYFQNKIRQCLNSDITFLLSHDRTIIPILRQIGLKNCIHMPIATSLHESQSDDNVPPLRTPLLFVGGVSLPEQFDEWLAPFSKEEQFFAGFAARQILEQNEWRQKAILLEFNRTHPQLAGRFTQTNLDFQHLWFVIDKALTSQLRIDTVAAVAEFGITVCGSYLGWKDAFGSTPGVELLPTADYRTELPGLYQNAKIVVNRSPLNLQDAVQQRILDVGAVGGFVLTEYQPILEDLFEIGRELDVYTDLDDLRNKVAYYLSHSDVRSEMAQRLHEKVLAEHTWRIRLEQVLSIMQPSRIGAPKPEEF